MTNVCDLSEITHRFVTKTGSKVIKSCLDSGGYVILRSLRDESFKTHFPLDREDKQHKKKKCQDKQLMGLAINGSVFVMKEIYICPMPVEMFSVQYL